MNKEWMVNEERIEALKAAIERFEFEIDFPDFFTEPDTKNKQVFVEMLKEIGVNYEE